VPITPWNGGAELETAILSDGGDGVSAVVAGRGVVAHEEMRSDDANDAPQINSRAWLPALLITYLGCTNM